MAGIQTNRTATGVVLPKEVSSQIWQDAQASSAVMQFASRIDLPGAGVQIPMITGDPTANWVNETDEIGVGDSTFSSKSIAGYKIGVVEIFSNEFKRDLPALYAELAKRLPKTIAAKFDSTVFHSQTAPGSDFDLLFGAQSVVLDATDTYKDIVDIDQKIADANGVNTGFVLAPKARGILLKATASTGSPLLIQDLNAQSNVERLLGVPVALNKAVYSAAIADPDAGGPLVARTETLGFAGDWSQAMFGVVEDIEVAVSTEATINKGGTQVNLFQRDMFALRVTAHLGFGVRDLTKFVRVAAA